MKPGISRSRVPITRLFALVALVLVLFTSGPFEILSPPAVCCEMAGFLLLSIAAFGRLWALVYISGNKHRELVLTGPYSMMRHPLYFFSFVGILGIGLVSKNLLVFGAGVVFYIACYPLAVVSEEKMLVEKFGQAYLNYQGAVPAILPRPSLYQAESQYTVNMSKVIRRIGDATWFIWVFMLLQGIQALQHWGIVPVLWTVP